MHWRACLDPDAAHLEIDGSHMGMAHNAKVFRAIAEQLAPVQLRKVASRRPARSSRPPAQSSPADASPRRYGSIVAMLLSRRSSGRRSSPAERTILGRVGPNQSDRWKLND